VQRPLFKRFVCSRVLFAGPLNLSQSTGSNAIPPSPASSTSSGTMSGLDNHSTVVQRINDTADGSTSTSRHRQRRKSGRGQRKTVQEKSEMDAPEKHSRMGCNSRGDSGMASFLLYLETVAEVLQTELHVRPIKIVREHEKQTVISSQPPIKTQKLDSRSRSKDQIRISIHWEGFDAPFMVSKRDTIRSVIDKACKHFQIDSTRYVRASCKAVLKARTDAIHQSKAAACGRIRRSKFKSEMDVLT
jgi:hypothetical protein